MLELRTGTLGEGSPEDRVCLGDSGIARAVAASATWGFGDLMAALFSGPLFPDDDSHMRRDPCNTQKISLPSQKRAILHFLGVAIGCNYPISGLLPPGFG